MIEESKKAGADAVKLQTVFANDNYVKGSKSYKEFQKTNFTKEELFKIIKYSKQKKLIFISTPGSLREVDLLVKLRVDGIKISSGSLTNYPLIRHASKKTSSLILSTGMAYEQEIKQALRYCGLNKNIAVLKCTSLYPPQDNELNLNSIKTFKKRFKKIIGYSDHKKDYLSCLIAVNNGAKIIEKHFTLNSNRKGKDHHISLEPRKFNNMVNEIRRLETIGGKNEIIPSKREIKNRKSYHRCIVANQIIQKGEKFSSDNLGLKRVNKSKNYGLEPKFYFKIIKKRASRKILKNLSIKRNFVNWKA